jgi:hypothetical protein
LNSLPVAFATLTKPIHTPSQAHAAMQRETRLWSVNNLTLFFV